MEKCKAVRGGHRSGVSRLINRTDEKITQNEITNQELRAAVDALERKREILQQLDNQIVDITEFEDMEQEILDSDDYSMKMDIAIHRYKDLLCKPSQASGIQPAVSELMYIPETQTHAPNFPSTSSTNHNTNHFQENAPMENVSVNASAQPVANFYHKLPKLDLPTFSGDILTWQTFWESFETTVHLNPALTNVQKFSYLKSQIHHEAAQCIAGLSLTSANYEQAIFLLKDRYGQVQTIVNAYMQSLLELPNPSLTPHSLRLFHDRMESSIRGLESLGQSQDTYGSLLIPIILGKLPAEMRKHMTREHGKQNWDIRSLREAIAKEMYVQEAGNLSTQESLTPTASFHTGSVTKANNKHQYKGRVRIRVRSLLNLAFSAKNHILQPNVPTLQIMRNVIP